MMVLKWSALAGAMLFAAGGGATAPRALAQDQDPLVRALDVVGRGMQLGASVSEVEGSDAKQAKSGVVVDTVTPDGPADKAGIKSGDVITEFDGERVRSVRQFSRLVQESTPDRSIAVALMRGSQRVNVNVTLERRSRFDDSRLYALPRAGRIPTTPTPPAAPRALRPPAVVIPDTRFGDTNVFRLFNTRGIGVTIESIDSQLAEYFGVKEGVLVKSVLEDSPAKKAGFKAGDVITSFNGSKVYDVSDLTRAIDRLETDAEFTVEVMRERKPQTLKGKFEGQPRRRTRTIL